MTSLSVAIAKHGLDSCREAILAFERPCVYLTLGAPTEPAKPGNQIGGRPFLPPTLPWPTGETGRPLTFVLQLDLAALSPLTEVPVPKSGLLSFFVDGGWPSARNVPCLCLCLDGNLEPRCAPTTDNDPHVDVFAGVPPHHFDLQAGSDIPVWYSSDRVALAAGISEDEEEALSLSQELAWSVQPNATKGALLGKLFGYAVGIGDDPRQDAQHDRGIEAGRWRNLLILESCRELDVCIWDAGYFEVMISDTDLAAARFANLYAKIESS